MEANKESEPKVKFSKLSSRKTKIVVISIVAVVLLLGAVVAVSLDFALRKTTPTRLAEVNLGEGETLTYKVDQRIEITGNNEQKGMFLFIFHDINVFILSFSYTQSLFIYWSVAGRSESFRHLTGSSFKSKGPHA